MSPSGETGDILVGTKDVGRSTSGGGRSSSRVPRRTRVDGSGGLTREELERVLRRYPEDV